MGWERRGHQVYYYRKTSQGGRKLTLYFGQGEGAQIAARQDEAKRQARARLKIMLAELRAEDKRAEAMVTEFEELAQAVVSGYLISQGFHTYKRQWRRNRGRGKENNNRPGSRKISGRRQKRGEKIQGALAQNRTRKTAGGGRARAARVGGKHA